MELNESPRLRTFSLLLLFDLFDLFLVDFKLELSLNESIPVGLIVLRVMLAMDSMPGLCRDCFGRG